MLTHGEIRVTLCKLSIFGNGLPYSVWIPLIFGSGRASASLIRATKTGEVVVVDSS